MATKDSATRKLKRAEQTRRAIVDGARRVFSRTGFEAATMQEIAAEAGYGAPALYNYFSGKDEIVAIVAQEVAGKIVTALSRNRRVEEDFRGYFMSLVASAVRQAEEDRAAFSLLLTLGDPDQAAPGPLRQPAARINESIVDRLAYGMESGELRLMSPETAARFVTSMIRTTLNLYRSGGDAKRLDSLLEELGEFVFHGLHAR